MSLSIPRIVCYDAISFCITCFGASLWKRWAYRLKIRRIKRCALDKAKGVVPVLLPKEYYTPRYYAYKKNGRDPWVEKVCGSEFNSLKKTFLFMLYYSFPKYLSYEHLRLLAETSNPSELEKVVYYCVESKKVEMRKGHLGCFKMTLSTYCIMGQPSIVQKIPCMKE
jgi:hypothetical protein